MNELQNGNLASMAICERHFELREHDQLAFQLRENVRLELKVVSCSMVCITMVMFVGSKHILDRVGRMQGTKQNRILRNITYVHTVRAYSSPAKATVLVNSISDS